jgi:hypothetical protein
MAGRCKYANIVACGLWPVMMLKASLSLSKDQSKGNPKKMLPNLVACLDYDVNSLQVR